MRNVYFPDQQSIVSIRNSGTLLYLENKSETIAGIQLLTDIEGYICYNTVTREKEFWNIWGKYKCNLGKKILSLSNVIAFYNFS